MYMYLLANKLSTKIESSQKINGCKSSRDDRKSIVIEVNKISKKSLEIPFF